MLDKVHQIITFKVISSGGKMKTSPKNSNELRSVVDASVSSVGGKPIFKANTLTIPFQTPKRIPQSTASNTDLYASVTST